MFQNGGKVGWRKKRGIRLRKAEKLRKIQKYRYRYRSSKVIVIVKEDKRQSGGQIKRGKEVKGQRSVMEKERKREKR